MTRIRIALILLIALTCLPLQAQTYLNTGTVVGAAAAGSSVKGNPVYIGGKNPSGNVVPWALDANGYLFLSQSNSLIGSVAQYGSWVLGTGSNVIGGVTQSGTWNVSVSNFPSTQAVTGTFWQTTQPVSIATLPSLAAGSNTIGNVNINGTVPVSGTFWQTTQPVSGSVSITGTPSVIVSNFPSTQAVTGTFWQTTQPISASSLPLPSGASTSANQTNVQSAPGTPQTTAITIQGNSSGVAVPVSGTVAISGTPTISGTVTANAGTNLNTSALALESGGNLATVATKTTSIASTQTSGSQKTQIVDGSGNVIASTSNALNTSATVTNQITGYATSANQTAVQSSPGTAQTMALTIQGNASGIAVTVQSTPVTGNIQNFQQTTTASTAVHLTSTSYVVQNFVTLTESQSSSGNIYIGTSSSYATTGYILQPGTSVIIPAGQNINTFYLNDATSSDTVSIFGS